MNRRESDAVCFEDLPGGDLVKRGLSDLDAGIVSEYALLLQVAAPRLRRLGLTIRPLDLPAPYEHELYGFLEQQCGSRAYSRYNSMLRRIVSFARCLERAR